MLYKNQSPSYLYNIITTTNTHYTFRNSDKIPYRYYEKISTFDWLRGVQYWPYLYSVSNICTLLLNKKKETKNKTFDSCSKKIQPSSNSFFDCHNHIGIKYITRIRLGPNHLREHKFKHSFQDTVNRICDLAV